MTAADAGILAAAVVGFLAGMFVTLIVLVAVDAWRYGRRRRPALDAARHGTRDGLLRITGGAAPASSTAVTRRARP